MPTLTSDAYATGQALVALGEAAGLKPSDATYKRGIEFLLLRFPVRRSHVHHKGHEGH